MYKYVLLYVSLLSLLLSLSRVGVGRFSGSEWGGGWFPQGANYGVGGGADFDVGGGAADFQGDYFLEKYIFFIYLVR